MITTTECPKKVFPLMLIHTDVSSFALQWSKCPQSTSVHCWQ